MHGLILLAVYFLPFLVALARHNVSTGGILVVNLLFGWTGIGWVLALVWALTGASWADRCHPYYPVRYY
jgi:Superinfection immunity protein